MLEIEKKIVFRILLTYIVFGVFYIFTLGDFIVPLPIIYITIPVVAAYFFVLSIRSKKSWFLIAIPFIAVKDVFMEYTTSFVFIFSMISLLSWVIFGLFILRQKLVIGPLKKIYGSALILSILSLIPATFNFSWFVFPIIGLFGYMFYKVCEEKLGVANNKKINIIGEEVLNNPMNAEGLNPKKEHHLLTLQRINLLILLICGFYTITLFSIWSTTW